jgi:hypothetical protein
MALGGRAVAAIALAMATYGCVGTVDRPARATLATAIVSPATDARAPGDSAVHEVSTPESAGPRPPTTSAPTCRRPTIIDCRAEENSTRAACRAPRDVPPATLGRGFSLAAIDRDAAYGGGFVDCAELIVAASSETEGYGLLLSVDLVTGDRRLVSGTHGRGRARRTAGRGWHRRDASAELEGVRDVARGPDGAYYAFTAHPTTRPNLLRIVRVDPRTGNRALVWEWRKGLRSFACNESAPGLEIEPSSFAMGPDGSVYLATRDVEGGIGLVALDAVKGCRVVSRTARDSAANVGDGPVLAGGMAFPRFANGRVWALDALGLVSIDVKEGTRVRVSSAHTSPPIGGGDDFGSTSLAVSRRRAWTAGGATYPAVRLTLVDLETGERHGFHGISGPLADPGLGTRIWHYADSGVAVVSVGGGFAFFDPRTSVSNLFSR